MKHLQRLRSRFFYIFLVLVMSTCFFSMQAKAFISVADSVQKVEPLYFMNNTPINAGYMKKIDPTIIASVNVLTGKGATQKYGRKAKAGAVDITLKTEATQFNEQDSLVLLSEIKESKNTNDEVPTFPGGQAAWNEFLKNNLIFNFGTTQIPRSGNIIISMIVEKDGSLSNIQLIENTAARTGEEFVKALKKSQTWVPGLKNGKPVRVVNTMGMSYSGRPILR